MSTTSGGDSAAEESKELKEMAKMRKGKKSWLIFILSRLNNSLPSLTNPAWLQADRTESHTRFQHLIKKLEGISSSTVKCQS
uniref:Uncharacterized protein n=1 Tax=Solanum lycopersicum TaxID=4081 RepID=A0A3Q7FGZ4_SOLLC